jgi:hypothetical protein
MILPVVTALLFGLLQGSAKYCVRESKAASIFFLDLLLLAHQGLLVCHLLRRRYALAVRDERALFILMCHKSHL